MDIDIDVFVYLPISSRSPIYTYVWIDYITVLAAMSLERWFVQGQLSHNGHGW